MPEGLREKVDEFVRMPKAVQEEIIKRIASRPELARGVEKSLQPYRELERARDRGMER